jgi:hypothetical protein
MKQKRERERREKVGGWCETLHLTRGNRAKFMATKVPRQCLLVFLVKVGWRGSKTFGDEEGRDKK